MSLRSFILLISGGVVMLILVLFRGESRAVLGDAFESLEATHLSTVRQNAEATAQTASYALTTFGHLLENDNALTSQLLIAHEHGKKAQLDAIEKRLQAQIHCDRLKIVYRAELPTTEWNIPTATLRAGMQGKTTLALYPAREDVLLALVAPLRNFGEPIAVVLLGFNLNQTFAPKIDRATQAQVRFLNYSTPEFAYPVSFDERLRGYLAIQSAFISDKSQQTRHHMNAVGAFSLFLTFALVYLLLEFGFLRHFNRLVQSLNFAAEQLKLGIVVQSPAVKHPIREVGRLSQAFQTFSANLRHFKLRVQERSREEAFIEVVEQVSHDLKSPVSALDFMLADDNRPLDGRRDRLRECLLRIQQTLHLLAPKRGPLPADESEAICAVIVIPLIEQVVAEKQSQLSLRPDITVKSDFASDARLFAKLPANEFKRALSNLFDNAIQALDDGGNIRLIVEATETEIKIAIADNGRGIDSEVIPHLGERGATFQKPGGSGLGVWQAREMLKRIGGLLSLTSNGARGTTATVMLPRDTTAAFPIAKIRLPILLLGWLALGAASANAQSTAEFYFSHDLIFSKDPTEFAKSDRLHLSAKTPADMALNADYLTAVAKERITRSGRRAFIDESWLTDFATLLTTGTSQSAVPLLAPKLRIEVQRERSANVVTLLWVAYAATRENPLRYLPQISVRRMRFNEGTLAEISPPATQFIRKSVDEFIRGSARVQSTAVVNRIYCGTIRAEYQARREFISETENPAAAAPRKFQVGASVGTPAIANLHLGIWGLGSFPLVTSLSGMIYSSQTRGLQYELGFAFHRNASGRNGALEQAINLSFALLNEHRELSEDKFDAVGNLLRTENTAVDQLKFYLGPSYTLQWNGFRVQGGIVFRPGDGVDPATRLLFQLGYCPTFSF